MLFYLLNDFDEQGIILAKSAKDIAQATGLPSCETYKTLDALREDGFIWRVGRRKLYRYGLKKGADLDYLCTLFRCIKYNRPLPEHLQISYETLDRIREEAAQRERDEELWREIEQLKGAFELIPEQQRLTVLEEAAADIASKFMDEFIYSEGDKKFFLSFLEQKIGSIWEEIIGARIKEEGG